MLSVQGYIDLLNDNSYKFALKAKWEDIYYGMSLHIDGACPYYKLLRDGYSTIYPGSYELIYPERFYGLRYQWIFDNVLFSRHPREAEETRQWRLSQYRPFQQAPFLQCIQMITGALFQDSGFGISIENKDDNDYIWGKNFDGMTLVGFLNHHANNIFTDPNGVFITIPKEPYYATTTTYIEPEIWFIRSTEILHLTKDEIVFTYGDYHWAVNGYGYLRFKKNEATGKFENVDTDYGYYYAHMMLKTPAIVAGGIWNQKGYYESWLQAGKPLADEFVSSKSAEQLVNKEASHPFIVEASEECPNCNGLGQIQWCGIHKSNTDGGECGHDCSNAWQKINCNTCGGSGTVSHNPGQRILAPQDQMDKSLVQIINPNIDINKFHAENNANIYNSIKAALHLNYIEVAQSGVAKDYDMQTRYQFVLSISNDWFDRVIPNMIKSVLMLRNVQTVDGKTTPYVNEEADYVITKPTQFKIKTAQELLDEYKTAKESSLPDYQLAAKLEDYADKQFGGDDILMKKTCVINKLDKLAMKNAADLQICVMNNAASVRDWQFSISLPYILDEMIEEKGQDWFLDAPYKNIKEDVNIRFAAIKPPIPEVRDTIDINRTDIGAEA